MLSAPQPLAGHHQLSAFDCGEPSLDDWLKRRAAKNQANGSSRTYVVCEGDQPPSAAQARSFRAGIAA